MIKDLTPWTHPMSQVIQEEALTRLLIEKGIFSKEEFLEIVKVVNKMNKKVIA